jgi:hypothetical protein
VPMNTHDPSNPLHGRPWYVRTLPAMRTRYEGTVADAQEDAMAAKLAKAGVFDAADDFFDALEAGEDVLTDHVDAHELVERLKLQRPA